MLLVGAEARKVQRNTGPTPGGQRLTALKRVNTYGRFSGAMVHSINTNGSCAPGWGPQEYQDGQLWGPKVETGCPLLAARARLLNPARYHQAGPWYSFLLP